MKKIISTLIILAMTLSMASCTSDEATLIKSMFKTYDIESAKINSSVDIELTADVTPEVIEDMKPRYLPSILSALSDFSFSSESVFFNKEDDLRSSSKCSVKTPNFQYDFMSYADGDKENLDIYAQIPTLFRALLPEGHADERYVNLNFQDFKDNEDLESSMFFSPLAAMPNAGFSALIGGSRDFSQEGLEIIMPMLLDLDFDENLVSKTGSVYTLTLTDENLKNIAYNFVDKVFTDEDFRDNCYKIKDLTRDFYSEVYGAEFAQQMNFDDLDFGKTDEELENNYKTTITQLDEFYADNKIIGDDNFVINFTVDKAGFITKIEENINLVLNFDNNVVNAKIISITEYSEINQVKDIELPEFGEDTIKLTDWISAYTTEKKDYPTYEEMLAENPNYIGNHVLPAEDGSITIVKGEFVMNTENKPFIQNDIIYIPLFEYLKLRRIDGTITDGTVTIYNKGITSTIDVGDTAIKNEFYTNNLTAPIVQKDYIVYAPLRSFNAALGYFDITWNEQFKVVNLNY